MVFPFLYYRDAKKYESPFSPLYSRYNDYGQNERLRNILSGSVNWKPGKNFEITGRLSYDTSSNSYDGYNVPRWDDSVQLPNFMTPFSFSSQSGFEQGTPQWQAEYNDALAAYRKATQELEAFGFPEPLLVSNQIRLMRRNLNNTMLLMPKAKGNTTSIT